MVNDSSSVPIVDGTTSVLRGLKVSCRVGVVSTRERPSMFFRCTGATRRGNFGIVVTNTKVTTRLPKVYTTVFPVPIVNVPVRAASLKKQSSLCSVMRVPDNVPITAMTVGNNTGTKLLTTGVLTASSTRLLSELGTCDRSLGRRIRGGSTELRRIKCGGCWVGLLPWGGGILSWKKRCKLRSFEHEC